jgi:hypothetical protein
MPDDIVVFKLAKGDDLVSQLLSHQPYSPEDALRENLPDPETAFRLATWTEHLSRVLYEMSCQDPAGSERAAEDARATNVAVALLPEPEGKPPAEG